MLVLYSDLFLLSTPQKSSLFLAAWPGSFRLFSLCTGRLLSSLSRMNKFLFKFQISRIDDFLWIKDFPKTGINVFLDRAPPLSWRRARFVGDLAHRPAMRVRS